MEPLPGHTFQFLNVGMLHGVPHVACVELNRPAKSNAFHAELWHEFPKAINMLDSAASSHGVRVVGHQTEAWRVARAVGSRFHSVCPHGPDKRAATRQYLHTIKIRDVGGRKARCSPPPHFGCRGGAQVLLVGNGANFCAGIDLQYLMHMFKSLQQEKCPGRMRERFRRHILSMQDCFTALERCRLPVVAAVHGNCIGGGVDLISACDIRVCSTQATFCVKEADVGIVADLGTLQRLGKIIGFGPTMELALTARTISAERALQLGLVTQVVDGDRHQLMSEASRLAASLAAKSPLALAGTKQVLLHARDSTVLAGMDYVATWNSAQLLSDDLAAVLAAMRTKAKPQFSKL